MSSIDIIHARVILSEVMMLAVGVGRRVVVATLATQFATTDAMKHGVNAG